MKKNTVRNGAIVIAVLGVMGGIGTMAANAGTTPATTTSASTATATQDPAGRSTQAEDQTAASANAAAAPMTSCVAVKVKKTGRNDAKLCATVQRDGLRVNKLQITLTTPAKVCTGKVTLGATTDRGAAITRATACTGGNRSTTTLTVNRTVAGNSQVCGTLTANARLTAAKACIRVTR